jgi:hypothetical protein
MGFCHRNRHHRRLQIEQFGIIEKTAQTAYGVSSRGCTRSLGIIFVRSPASALFANLFIPITGLEVWLAVWACRGRI